MILREILYWQMLERNLHLDVSTLKKNQLKALRRMSRYAYENVPFYHRKLKNAGLSPDFLTSLEDMKKIPATTKSEIQSSSVQDVVSKKFRPEELSFRSTSGSTGNPLKIAFNGNTLDFESALWLMARSENRFRIRDKMSVICDPRIFPTRNKFLSDLGFLRRQYLSIFDAPEDQLRHLDQFKPDAIKGYPSSLAILADFLEE
jgi:phenylacetate-CoA ligase